MKNIKPPFKLDERNKLTAYKIMAVMYLLTIISMHGISIYRQFALGQSIQEFEDFAVVMTVNSIFLVSALLYFGAIPIQKIRVKIILLAYAGIVVLGSVFTYFKYNVFHEPGLSFQQVLNKLIIIISISGLLVFFFVIFSILGKRKIDRHLEE